MTKLYLCTIFFIVLICPIKLQTMDQDLAQTLTKYENTLTPNGYHFHYKTDNLERAEDGVIEETDKEIKKISVAGYYSFKGTDGRIYLVQFQADENGYRPFIQLITEAPFVEEEKPKQPVKMVPQISSAAVASLVGGGLG